LGDDERVARIAELVREFLRLIGEDPEREGLRETPERVARMWVRELSSGYWENPRTYLKTFDGSYLQFGDMVVIRDAPVRSMCEHHLLPFFGRAHLAYIPDGQVLGFSKFSRVVSSFARRLQLQERLTAEVANFLYRELSPKGLFLVIEATHTCALVRGVEEPLYMVTTAARGVFREMPELIERALRLIGLGGRAQTLLRTP